MNKWTDIHWFDLDGTIWSTDAMWWIIDKNDPANYIIKISQHEGSLILAGFHKNDGHKITYNGHEMWISKDVWAKIQRKKSIKAEDIGVSWREFSDSILIEKQAENVEFHLHRIHHLCDTNHTINLLTARGNKKAHDLLLTKLNQELDKINVNVNKSFFTSDPLSVQIAGNTPMKKAMIMLQFIVGYQIKDAEFVPLQLEAHQNTYFYDDEDKNIEAAINMNNYLRELLTNTQPWLKDKIISKVNEHNPCLYANLVSSNELNPFETTKVDIKILD